jgi:hypothetical protein
MAFIDGEVAVQWANQCVFLAGTNNELIDRSACPVLPSSFNKQRSGIT